MVGCRRFAIIAAVLCVGMATRVLMKVANETNCERIANNLMAGPPPPPGQQLLSR
jgi:hypothetical protein